MLTRLEADLAQALGNARAALLSPDLTASIELYTKIADLLERADNAESDKDRVPVFAPPVSALALAIETEVQRQIDSACSFWWAECKKRLDEPIESEEQRDRRRQSKAAADREHERERLADEAAARDIMAKPMRRVPINGETCARVSPGVDTVGWWKRWSQASDVEQREMWHDALNGDSNAE